MIFAIFSALCPIVSPVLGSAIAGVTGMKSLGRIRAKAPSRAPSDFAFDAATRMSERPREWRIGTLLSDSAPPAIATSAWPSAIWSPASVIAWFALAHARLTEKACTSLGSAGISATSRAMFGARTDGTTVPKTSASTSVPSSWVRAMSSDTTARPRSSALTVRSVVPERAKGVRSPATIATRRPLP